MQQIKIWVVLLPRKTFSAFFFFSEKRDSESKKLKNVIFWEKNLYNKADF